jgi:hypothetical protein
MNNSKLSDSNNFNEKNPSLWVNAVDKDLTNIFMAMQGRLRFGANNTATNMGENISGQFVTYTSNGTINTQDTVRHNLGSVPVGYIVINKNKAGDFYTSAAATSTSLFLKCSVASVTATLFLLQ